MPASRARPAANWMMCYAATVRDSTRGVAAEQQKNGITWLLGGASRAGGVSGASPAGHRFSIRASARSLAEPARIATRRPLFKLAVSVPYNWYRSPLLIGRITPRAAPLNLPHHRTAAPAANRKASGLCTRRAASRAVEMLDATCVRGSTCREPQASIAKVPCRRTGRTTRPGGTSVRRIRPRRPEGSCSSRFL